MSSLNPSRRHFLAGLAGSAFAVGAPARSWAAWAAPRAYRRTMSAMGTLATITVFDEPESRAREALRWLLSSDTVVGQCELASAAGSRRYDCEPAQEGTCVRPVDDLQPRDSPPAVHVGIGNISHVYGVVDSLRYLTPAIAIGPAVEQGLIRIWARLGGV